VNSFDRVQSAPYDWRDSIRSTFPFLKRDDWIHPKSLYAQNNGEFAMIFSEKNCYNRSSWGPLVEDQYFSCKSVSHSLDNTIHGVAYGPIVCYERILIKNSAINDTLENLLSNLNSTRFRNDLNGKFVLQIENMQNPDVHTVWDYIAMYVLTSGWFGNIKLPEFILSPAHKGIIECLTSE
jgi:hypothetical protein